MSREYTWKKPDGDLAKPGGLTKVMAAAALRLVAGHGPFDITKDGELVAENKTRRAALRKLRKLLSDGKVGPTYRVRDKKDVVFLCREVKSAVHVIDTSGNKKCDLLWTGVKAQFPYVWFLGAYVCKTISGSSSRSQHSFGNAVDVGAPSDRLDEIAQWGLHNFEKCLRNVIYKNRIWSRGMGWHTYTGDYHSTHVHFDFAPECSGSCRVVQTGDC